MTRFGFLFTILMCALAMSATPAMAQDQVYVDPAHGNDNNPGSRQQPYETLGRGVAHIRDSGGTLHLAADAVFREPLVLRGGKTENPITIEGNGATIDLGTDVTDGPWIADGDGYILDIKLPRNPGNAPWQMASLYVDGYPIVAYDPRFADAPRPGQYQLLNDGKMRVVFREGTRPGVSRVMANADYNVSCVDPSGLNNVTIRHLHAKYAGNDGFNIHGKGRGVVLENVAAMYCGDEGISAHGTVEMKVTDSVVAFCGSQAGGIADVGNATTTYRRCVIVGNRGAAFFMQGQKHRIEDCIVLGNGMKLRSFKSDVQVSNLIDIDSRTADIPVRMRDLASKARELLASRE